MKDLHPLLAVLRRDFRAFAQFAFDVTTPGVPFEDTWHIGAIAHALVAWVGAGNSPVAANLPSLPRTDC